MILLVEDDKLLGEAIVQTLSAEGFQVFWAKSGEEALKVLELQEISLVYLDIMLPGEMDGYDIIRKIKTDPRWKDLSVVMLTNLGQMSEIDRAMELGATDYFIKANIDLEKLINLTKERILR